MLSQGVPQVDPDLSVIIPAYNEAERIIPTLQRINDYLASRSLSSEILVVLDGPTDNTIGLLREVSEKVPNLRILDRHRNRGKGYTVREGMLKASGRLRLFCDADNSTDIAHFDKMIPLFKEGYDIVIASRHSKDAAGAQQAVPQARYKRIIGQFGNIIYPVRRRTGNLGYAVRIQGFSRGSGRANFLSNDDRGMGF